MNKQLLENPLLLVIRHAKCIFKWTKNGSVLILIALLIR